MAAGLGFKTFNTGDVLTAADVNGYLMQGVLVFADATARDAAITSPQEGQFAYTKDNNSLWYYTGSAWAASGATGDIEGVTAGVGISGGGTSGTVTITNSMATAIDAKGDLIVGTGADTFSRLAVGGTNDHVLTVDSSTATGLKWAAAPSPSYTWTTWTPSYNGLTVGNGTVVSKYIQIGKLVVVKYYFQMGSTSSVTGQIQISLPIAPTGSDYTAGYAAPTMGLINDAGTGVFTCLAYVFDDSGTPRAAVNAMNASATYTTQTATSSTVPMTWTTNDRLSFIMTYEVA